MKIEKNTSMILKNNEVFAVIDLLGKLSENELNRLGIDNDDALLLLRLYHQATDLLNK